MKESSGAVRKIARILVPRETRNWLRSPAKSAVWLWDGIRHAIGSDLTVELRPGWRVACHPAAYRFAYRSQLEDPEQSDEFDSFIAHCRPGMVLFDVGAHFGAFSLAALHYGGPHARAIAVDPSPAAVRMLAVQARLNGLDGRLTAVEASVGESSGERMMVSGGVLSHGYYLSPEPSHTGSELTRTRGTTLDELFHGYGPPSHVKIDVEGAEAAVFKGGRELLTRRDAPLLFVELHNEMVRGRGASPEEALELLADYRYRVLSLQGADVDRKDLLLPAVVRVVARKEAADV